MEAGVLLAKPSFPNTCIIKESIDLVLKIELLCKGKKGSKDNTVGKVRALKLEELCLRPASYKLYYSANPFLNPLCIIGVIKPALPTSPDCCEDQRGLCV